MTRRTLGLIASQLALLAFAVAVPSPTRADSLHTHRSDCLISELLRARLPRVAPSFCPHRESQPESPTRPGYGYCAASEGAWKGRRSGGSLLHQRVSRSGIVPSPTV